MSEGPASPPRLLVAEDNLANQKVMHAMLARLGYEADVVGNGAQAVEAFQHGRYDAVLMDCQMPVMDGYAATAAIRELEGPETHVPIIAVTASAMDGVAQRCLAVGMDDYLSKPIMFGDLQAALRRWVATPADPSTPAAGHPSQGPPVEVFDPERVAALRMLDTSGKTDAFIRFATMFLQQARGRMAALGQALADGDAAQARHEAHALRGSAATIGAVGFADKCAQLEERLLAAGQADPQAFAPIRAEFERIRSALAHTTMESDTESDTA